MLKIYRITKMTGRYCDELREEALQYLSIFNRYGIKVLDPVLLEGLPHKHIKVEKLPNKQLKHYWERDKQCLREAHVAINCNALNKSIGGEHEQGLMRFGYWKPLVLIYPNLEKMPFISTYEDDYVCESIDQACQIMLKKWELYPKRLLWRIKLLFRCVPKFIFRQIRFLFQ